METRLSLTETEPGGARQPPSFPWEKAAVSSTETARLSGGTLSLNPRWKKGQGVDVGHAFTLSI